MRTAVVNCTGSLTATSRVVDVGSFVGHLSECPFIVDPKTGEFDLLERNDGCFELELEVIPYNVAAPILKDLGFHRRP